MEIQRRTPIGEVVPLMKDGEVKVFKRLSFFLVEALEVLVC